MPFARRHVRVTGGSIPEARRGGTSKKAARVSKGSTRGGKADKGGLTEAKKAEITAALLAKWEQEGVGIRRKAPSQKSGGGRVAQRDSVGARPTAEPRSVGRPPPDKAKRPANAQRRSTPAKHPSPKSAKTRERKSDSRQPITKEEGQQLERRLPGVGRLLAFFSAAGALLRSRAPWELVDQWPPDPAPDQDPAITWHVRLGQRHR